MGKTITIKQGDADTITEVITGLSSLVGYTAKLLIYNGTTLIDTITGTIATLTITYQLLNEDTKAYPLGTYKYETKLFDSSDHVYTPSYGAFEIEETIEEDPS